MGVVARYVAELQRCILVGGRGREVGGGNADVGEVKEGDGAEGDELEIFVAFRVCLA